jgi:hypothetical protein
VTVPAPRVRPAPPAVVAAPWATSWPGERTPRLGVAPAWAPPPRLERRPPRPRRIAPRALTLGALTAALGVVLGVAVAWLVASAGRVAAAPAAPAAPSVELAAGCR